MSNLAIQEYGTATIGHNMPPKPTPYEAIKLHIDDLAETAQGFLDGEPIATQAQADAVGRILDDARQARKAADEQRKLEAKPFDDGKKAVQALWTPLTDERVGKCALITDTCKKALAPWMKAAEDAQLEAARIARAEADEKARIAQEAIRAADLTNLAAREEAEKLLKEAGKADKAATRASNERAQVAGGDRAVSLRTSYRGEIVDPVRFGKWAWEHCHAEYLEFLTGLAERVGRQGKRPIPGIIIHVEKNAA